MRRVNQQTIGVLSHLLPQHSSSSPLAWSTCSPATRQEGRATQQFQHNQRLYTFDMAATSAGVVAVGVRRTGQTVYSAVKA